MLSRPARRVWWFRAGGTPSSCLTLEVSRYGLLGRTTARERAARGALVLDGNKQDLDLRVQICLELSPHSSEAIPLTNSRFLMKAPVETSTLSLTLCSSTILSQPLRLSHRLRSPRRSIVRCSFAAFTTT